MPEDSPLAPAPTIGRIVWYRTDGRNGLEYDLPAIVTCTKDTHPGHYPDGSSNPLPVPSSNWHAHLTVFTPGGFGTTVQERGADYAFSAQPQDSAQFKGASGFTPGSGTYVELDVPFCNEDENPAPRSWRWPTRV